MSILVDKNTRVLCQGLGKAGTFHATQCRDYGTQVVGGVVPGKGGTTKEGFPLFIIVAITEGIPVLDMARAMRFVKERGAGAGQVPAPAPDRGVRLIGPNCPGI